MFFLGGKCPNCRCAYGSSSSIQMLHTYLVVGPASLWTLFEPRLDLNGTLSEASVHATTVPLGVQAAFGSFLKLAYEVVTTAVGMKPRIQKGSSRGVYQPRLLITPHLSSKYMF